MPLSRSLQNLEDFRSRSVETPTGCWEWQTHRDAKGYGRSADDKRVHRLVAALVLGDVEGKVVMHRCDNPPCCNPDHLAIGTQADNIRDALTKGRMDSPGPLVGEANHKRQRTECPNGHPYDAENTRWTPGGRLCRTCIRLQQRRYRAKKAA